jgi:hypothetical protein
MGMGSTASGASDDITYRTVRPPTLLSVQVFGCGHSRLSYARMLWRKSGEDKLRNGTIIANEKLPAAVFVFTNRTRCAPSVDDDGCAVGRRSINLEYRGIGPTANWRGAPDGYDATHVFRQTGTAHVTGLP